MKHKPPCIIFIVLILVFYAVPSFGGAKDKDQDLSGFLNATYGLIGKKPGSSQTYCGAVTIKPHGETIEVIRCIGSLRITGKGSIISLTNDRIPNLKVRWHEGKDDYEALYMVHSDADNYARLSGPYVRLNDETKLGWELLYVDPDSSAACQ